MVKPDGNKRDHYRYDEYGNPAPGNSKLSEDGRNVLHNTFGYTGEMWDQESELLYLRARYYEPETGRFLSRDSYEGNLQNPLSRHLYAYVGNNPVNYVDPIGNWGSSPYGHDWEDSTHRWITGRGIDLVANSYCVDSWFKLSIDAVTVKSGKLTREVPINKSIQIKKLNKT